MKTIQEMARDAGLKPDGDDWGANVYRKAIEAFAELVREEANARANASWTLMCEKMVAIEREAVLDLVDGYAKNNTDLRDAIRARGEQA